jgi:hypothetical protein
MPVFLYSVAIMNESKNSFKALAKHDLDSVLISFDCVTLCLKVYISTMVSDDGTEYVGCVFLFKCQQALYNVCPRKYRSMRHIK